MSRNVIEIRTWATGRRRLLAVLAGCMAAGLGASGCDDEESACTRPFGEPTAFIEVRDRNGACTDCTADGGLTFVVGLANGCDDVARFTTASGCLVEDFMLIRESGEMVSAGFGCIPVITDWEMQPGEVMSREVEWGRGQDQLSSSWGPIEPGRYRFLVRMHTDLMTDSEIAPAVESEIVVRAP